MGAQLRHGGRRLAALAALAALTASTFWVDIAGAQTPPSQDPPPQAEDMRFEPPMLAPITLRAGVPAALNPPPLAEVPAGDTVVYSSAALPGGLTLDAATGTITGTPAAAAPSADYTVTATASPSGATASFAASIEVAVPAPRLERTHLGRYGFSSGHPFSVEAPEILDLPPDAVVVWSIGRATRLELQEKLIPNLAVDRYGTVSGLPAASTSRAYRIPVTARVFDGSDRWALTYSFDLTLRSGELLFRQNQWPGQRALLSSGHTDAVSIGANDSIYNDVGIKSESPAFSIEPSLPAGVTLDTTTGAISGTPTELSPRTDYTVTATLTDERGTQTASYTVPLAVVPPMSLESASAEVTISPEIFWEGVLTEIHDAFHDGSGYLTVSDGTDDDSCLPDGAFVEAVDGELKLTMGTYGITSAIDTTCTLTVTDAHAQQQTAQFSLRIVVPAEAVMTYERLQASPRFQSVEVGEPVSVQPPLLSNFVGDITYSLSPAASWLSLDADADFPDFLTVSGTPTAAQAATAYTVTATDSSTPAQQASFTFEVEVTEPPVRKPQLTIVGNATLSPQTATVGSSVEWWLPFWSETDADVECRAASLPPGLACEIAVDSSKQRSRARLSGLSTAPAGLKTYRIALHDLSGKYAPTTVKVPVTVGAMGFADHAADVVAVAGGVFADVTVPALSHSSGTVTYSVTPALPDGLLFDTATGVISGSPTAAAAPQTYTVTATDTSAVPQQAQFPVRLTVQHVPMHFDSQELPEVHAEVGTPLATVSLPVLRSIPDSRTVRYSVTPALPAGLSIDAATGDITGTPTERQAQRDYTVTATALARQGTDDTVVTAQFTVTLEVAYPRMAFDGDAEHELVTTVGSQTEIVLPKLKNAPLRPTQNLAFRQTGLPDFLDFKASNDAQTFTITVLPILAAPRTTYTFTLRGDFDGDRGTTADAQTVEFKLHLTVHAMTLGASKIADLEATVGEPASTDAPPKADHAVLPLRYEFFDEGTPLPAGLSLDAATGIVSGTPTKTQARTTYTIAVYDSATLAQAQHFEVRISVAPPPLKFEKAALADQALDVRSPATISPPKLLNASGTANVAYSINPSALPAGLSFDTATGVISGTPAAGTAAQTFTITAADSGPPAQTASFTVKIAVANPPMEFAADSLGDLDAKVGDDIGKAGPPTLRFAVGSVTWAISPALPAGLTLDTATGVISGTPSAASASTAYTITATDSKQPVVQTAKYQFDIEVTRDPMAFAKSSLGARNAAKVDSKIRDINPPTLNHAVGDVAYAVSPALPAGLTLDTATGVISGTPTATAARKTYTVTATDSLTPQAQTARFTVDIEVTLPPMRLESAATISITVEAGVKQTFTLPKLLYAQGKVIYTDPTGRPEITLNDDGTFDVLMLSDRAGESLTLTLVATDSTGQSVYINYRASVVAAQLLKFASWAPTAQTVEIGKRVTLPVPDLTDKTSPPYFIKTAKASPSLPAGLRVAPIDSKTHKPGQIYGTALRAAPKRTYTITLSLYSSSGSHEASYQIELAVPPTAMKFARAASNAIALSTSRSWSEASYPPALYGPVGAVAYSISPDLPAGMNFNTKTGTISGSPTEALVETTFTITATDSSTPVQKASFTVKITVADPLTFTPASPSSVVQQGALVAIAPPTVGNTVGKELLFTMSGDSPLLDGLKIDSKTGIISGTASSSTGDATVTIKVRDVRSGRVVNEGSYDLTMEVSAASQTMSFVPAALVDRTALVDSRLRVEPPLVNNAIGPVTYSITPATLPAGLRFASSAGAISGTPTAESALTQYTVTATDASSPAKTASFTLKLATENPPMTFSSTAVTTIATLVDDSVAYTPPSVKYNDHTLAYSISPSASLPAGLALDTATGKITGTPTAELAKTRFTITATETDGISPQSASVELDLTVEWPPFTLAASTLDDVEAIVGVKVSIDPPKLNYPRTPAAFALTSPPTLPAGLQLDSGTGIISGTPTGIRSAKEYTVQVTDAEGRTASYSVSIAVAKLAFSGTHLPAQNWLVDDGPTSLAPLKLAGNAGKVTYSISPALPVGLSLDSDTGVISGTPTATSVTANYTVTATDSRTPKAQTAQFRVYITVKNPPLQVDPGTVSVTFDTHKPFATPAPVVKYGDGPLTFTNISASAVAAAGFSYDATTGVISGTSTKEASHTFQVFVLGQNGGKLYTVNVEFVCPPMSFVASSVEAAAATVGSDASISPPELRCADGDVSYKVSPALPAGLSLDSGTGVISGRPSASLTKTSYTVTATDSSAAAQTTSFTVDITVNAMGFARASLAAVAATTDTAISDISPPSLSHAVGDVSYAVGPALPAGLSLDSGTGVISGTPTASSAKATYTVTATDSSAAAQTARFAVDISVTDPPMSFGVSPVEEVIVTVGDQLTVAAPALNYPQGEISYAVSPALSGGLALTAAGGITGTTSEASSRIQYTVTATDSKSGGSQTASYSVWITVRAPVSSERLAFDDVAVDDVVGLEGVRITRVVAPALTGTGDSTVFSVQPDLPKGLKLTDAGDIRGVPAVAAVRTQYTVTATDTALVGRSASYTVWITVQPAMQFGAGDLGVRQYVAGVPIDPVVPPVLEHAVGEVVYSLSSDLPAGLSFDAATGVISGTPQPAELSKTYTITGTDSRTEGAQRASFEVKIKVTIAGSGRPQIGATKAANDTSIRVRWSVQRDGAPAALVVFPAGGEPMLAQLRGGAANPATDTQAGSHRLDTVVGLEPCTKYRLFAVHVSDAQIDDQQLRGMWAGLEERSSPLRFWTRSSTDDACGNAASTATGTVMLADLKAHERPGDRSRTQVQLTWDNPGGVESVALIAKARPGGNRAEDLQWLAQPAADHANPVPAGVGKLIVGGLEPCTVYFARVYERHPGFDSDSGELRVFRNHANRKTNEVRFTTAGCP